MKIDTLFFSDDKKVSLTSYVASVSQEMTYMLTRPAMLVIPGGGYRFCSDREAEPIALAYLAKGYNAFVLRYTVGEKIDFEAPFADAERALAYIKDNAQKLGVDSTKIAVIGFSAGGHLASSLGTIAKNRPTAMVLAYPCINKNREGVLSSQVPKTNEYIDKETPPTFIFSTANDGTVPIENSLAFAEGCAKAGVSFELHIFKDGSHGLSLADHVTCSSENKDVAKWFDLSCEWLRKVLDF